jgi:hypothetical protein
MGMEVSPDSMADARYEEKASTSGKPYFILRAGGSGGSPGTHCQQLVGIAGIDGAGVAVVTELAATRGARAREVAMPQVGLQGVLVDGDGVEVARVAGRHVADLDLGRPGRGAHGEDGEQQETTDRETSIHGLAPWPGLPGVAEIRPRGVGFWISF